MLTMLEPATFRLEVSPEIIQQRLYRHFRCRRFWDVHKAPLPPSRMVNVLLYFNSHGGVLRASECLPAYIVFGSHHEAPCARQWQGEKWWDGISDLPLKGRWEDIWRPYSANMCGCHYRRISVLFIFSCGYPRFGLPKVCYQVGNSTW